MALRDRLIGWFGRFAPVVGGAIFLFAVLVLFWPILAPLAADGGSVAWVVGILVVAYALGHLTIRMHVRRKGTFVRDEHGELAFRMESNEGTPPPPPQVGHPGHYGGRSHSGERPRFD